MALVQLSISDSPHLHALSLTQAHLQAAHLAIARRLLLRGHTLAYGGDLRSPGFTVDLLDLVRSLRAEGHRVAPLHSYVAWPLSAGSDPATWTALAGVAVPHEQPAPLDPLVESDATAVFPPDRPARRYAWAVGLTRMRRAIHDPSADASPASLADKRPAVATVLLGGRTEGFAGTVPGVLEELVIARQHETPVLLCAGFGGVAAVAAALLDRPGAVSRADALALLVDVDREHAAVHAWAGAGDRAPTAATLGAFIQDHGDLGDALGAPLDAAETDRLLCSTDPDELALLVAQALD